MSDRPPFAGFRAGARATVIPNLFFAEVLPAISDPAELVVSCYLFYLCGRVAGPRRGVTLHELRVDPGLRRALAREAGGAETALARGLAAAMERGTAVRHADRDGVRYTINSQASRRALAAEIDTASEIAAPAATEPLPTIYHLYEDTIGTISPLIADELRAAEADYPLAWIIDAFREAARANHRSWRYVLKILQRWQAEGRMDAAVGRSAEGSGDLAGRYRGLVRH